MGLARMQGQTEQPFVSGVELGCTVAAGACTELPPWIAHVGLSFCCSTGIFLTEERNFFPTEWMSLIVTVLNQHCEVFFFKGLMGFFSVLFAKQLYLQHDFDASESAGEHLVPELFFLLLPHEAGIKSQQQGLSL